MTPEADKNCDHLAYKNDELEVGESMNPENCEISEPLVKYKYEAPWPIYCMNWSVNPEKKFRLIVGSLLEKKRNELRIVTLNEDKLSFKVDCCVRQLFPPTKVMWIPDLFGVHPDLFATTSEKLRLWQITESGPLLGCALQCDEYRGYNPMTSFDWSTTDRNLICTSSNDSTCIIWDIETSQKVGCTNFVNGYIQDRFTAHRSAVYDTAFNPRERNLLASVGSDRMVKIFDLRDTEASTVMYRSPESNELVRLAWNKWDSKYLGIIALGSNEVKILDCRAPIMPVKILKHSSSVNSICWAPHAINHVATGGDNCKALIWDISEEDYCTEKPIFAHTAPAEIEQIQWSAQHTDYIAAGFQKTLEILELP